MSSSKKSDSQTTSSAKETPSTDFAQSQIEIETAQGFRGTEVDPTPNENYTVAGVTSGAPTPETDVKMAADVRQQTGLGMSALEAAARERGDK